MAFLVNRNPAARFECLHALMQFLTNNYGEKAFRLKDTKYDESDVTTVKDYCTLLLTANEFISYCRYKQNPLDEAGCGLTNGRDPAFDSTKTKEAGNTINALHGLGLLQRDGDLITITKDGFNFANTPFNSKEMQKIIYKAVLSYGPIIGMLSEIEKNQETGIFSSDNVRIGYPKSKEKVVFEDSVIEVSSGSEQDSMTRTRTCLLAWLTAAGIIEPIGAKSNASMYPQIKFRDFLNDPRRKARKFKVVVDINSIFTSLNTVKRPLDYDNLTKMTGSLRENGQALIRKATLNFESQIKNRRFAIIYILNSQFKKGKAEPLKHLESFLTEHPSLFIITERDFEKTLLNEIEIAPIAGIPYEVITNRHGIFLNPKNEINMKEVITQRTPQNVIEVLKEECHG